MRIQHDHRGRCGRVRTSSCACCGSLAVRRGRIDAEDVDGDGWDQVLVLTEGGAGSALDGVRGISC